MPLVSIFKNPVYVAIDAIAARLTKSGGGDSWNAGAISRYNLPQLLHNHGCRWKAVETNKSRMCGLSGNADVNQSYDDIEFAWFALADSTLQIYESGVLKTDEPRPAYAANELLEVNLEDLGDTRILSDDFNDNDLDPAKWTIANPASPQVVSETNSQLKIQLEPNTVAFNHIETANMNLSGKSFVVDVVEYPYQSGYSEGGICFWIDGNNNAFVFVSGGVIYARINNNGSSSYQTFGFDQAQVSKLRIRHNSVDGKIYFDSYHNSQGWRQHWTATPVFSMAAIQARIYAGSWNSYNPVGRFIVDNAKIEDFGGSGFVVRYYKTPDGGARSLVYQSAKDDSFIRSLLPLRIDSSLYQENGTIDSIEALGAGWQDESGQTRFQLKRASYPVQTQASKMINGGGGAGGGNEPPTIGQIFPRGLN